MTIRNTGPRILDPRRLAAHADLKGNADGVATRDEIAALKAEVAKATTGADADPIHPADVRTKDLKKVLGADEALPMETLDPSLRALPPAIRRLAIEVDGLWGEPDGKITVAELDRVARYYLAALPFFTTEASALLELAQHLGFAQGPAASKSVLSLRLAVAKVDKGEVARGAEFRALFDEAVNASDVPGLPGLLRDAALHQPKWHRLSVLEHSAVAVAAVRDLATAVGLEWKDAGAIMLLHDVGKILERKVATDPAGAQRYSFWGHEGLGAEWLATKNLDPELVFHVNNHSVLRESTVDQMKALCGTKERVAEAVVVYVADQVAKGNTEAQLASFAGEREKIRTLATYAGIDADTLFATRDRLIAEWFPTA